MQIVLDRDGVINRNRAEYIRSPEEWRPLPGSLEAIARLSRAGHRIFVATNQSGVGRGLFDGETLTRIHARMERAVHAAGGAIDAILFCPHAPEQGCDCRKPQPGLLRQIERRTGEPLQGCWLVGDSLSDLRAAVAVKMRPALVRTGNGEATAERGEAPQGTAVFADLAAFADALLAGRLDLPPTARHRSPSLHTR